MPKEGQPVSIDVVFTLGVKVGRTSTPLLFLGGGSYCITFQRFLCGQFVDWMKKCWRRFKVFIASTVITSCVSLSVFHIFDIIHPQWLTQCWNICVEKFWYSVSMWIILWNIWLFMRFYVLHLSKNLNQQSFFSTLCNFPSTFQEHNGCPLDYVVQGRQLLPMIIIVIITLNNVSVFVMVLFKIRVKAKVVSWARLQLIDFKVYVIAVRIGNVTYIYMIL